MYQVIYKSLTLSIAFVMLVRSFAPEFLLFLSSSKNCPGIRCLLWTTLPVFRIVNKVLTPHLTHEIQLGDPVVLWFFPFGRVFLYGSLFGVLLVVYLRALGMMFACCMVLFMQKVQINITRN